MSQPTTNPSFPLTMRIDRAFLHDPSAFGSDLKPLLSEARRIALNGPEAHALNAFAAQDRARQQLEIAHAEHVLQIRCTDNWPRVHAVMCREDTLFRNDIGTQCSSPIRHELNMLRIEVGLTLRSIIGLARVADYVTGTRNASRQREDSPNQPWLTWKIRLNSGDVLRSAVAVEMLSGASCYRSHKDLCKSGAGFTVATDGVKTHAFPSGWNIKDSEYARRGIRVDDPCIFKMCALRTWPSYFTDCAYLVSEMDGLCA